MPPSKTRHPAVALRADFTTTVKNRGITSQTAMANTFACNPSTIYRLLAGQTAPSADFIAAVLAAFPDARFEDFFTTT